ncbi:aminoglycoside phosphotransferase family protein [Candidatus Thiosymbion oneisti]|uniref:aminoglycoside phosphotransferase family protein n=1 Tax=Candidatus Thiosymbion oneisti TaxID=589554 RepID=UPI000A8D7B83|nr:phosphotransferase [Candidatus Thiosymbion oneisti]
MRERRALLADWIRHVLGRECRLEPVAGDASSRRYWRVRPDDRSYILMDAPPVVADIERFVRIAERLRALGLNTPQVYAQAPGQGLLLLADLGTRLYLDVLDQENADRLYGDALAALVVIQACASTEGLPQYDGPFLHRELALFRDWLLVRQLGWELSDVENAVLESACEFLVEHVLEQPRVWVHRDFHSRNLMVTAPPSPGILDFQDAVAGPVAYDPVSLLRDCYIGWPREQVEDWARGYATLAVHSGILRPQDADRFMTWFDLMGVQRHLKASGIFARLNVRDHKPGYLADIPRTLAYVLEVAPAYPRLTALADLIRERVFPDLPVTSTAVPKYR